MGCIGLINPPAFAAALRGREEQGGTAAGEAEPGPGRPGELQDPSPGAQPAV